MYGLDNGFDDTKVDRNISIFHDIRNTYNLEI